MIEYFIGYMIMAVITKLLIYKKMRESENWISEGEDSVDRFLDASIAFWMGLAWPITLGIGAVMFVGDRL